MKIGLTALATLAAVLAMAPPADRCAMFVRRVGAIRAPEVAG